MRFYQSEKPTDWLQAEQLLQANVKWLVAAGVPLWTSEQVSAESLRDAYPADSLYIAELNGVVAGVVFVVDSDPDFWPEVKDGGQHCSPLNAALASFSIV